MRLLVCRVLLMASATAASLAAADTVLTATVGTPFVYAPHFTGTNLRYTAEGLPAGLILDSRTGAIGGTPSMVGRQRFVITATNSLGSARHPVELAVAPAHRAPGSTPPPPPPASRDDGEEEDTPDPLLSTGGKVAPWTENQRRVIHNWFLPGAASLPAGDWYYRISHVAREAYDDAPRTNLLGLDDSVKIGIMLAYAPVKATTVSLQRVNGRDLAIPPVDGKNVQYDVWEPLVRYQLLDQRGVRGALPGPCDLNLLVGGSFMVRSSGTGDVGLDLGIIAERDLFNDRVRLGVGAVRAGLSTYEKPVTNDRTATDKRFPDEQDYLASQGNPVETSPAATVAIPVTMRLALAEHWVLLGEAVVPVSGYRTGRGPSYVAGFAYETNTHEFSFVFTNTANLSFNSVVSGGSTSTALPYFAFAIASYL